MDRTPNVRVMGGRWIHIRKIDGVTGQPSEFKSGFCTKGVTQIAGLDFGELYAAVAHKDSIRIFLAMVCHFELHCDQVDIVAAFLNGLLC